MSDLPERPKLSGGAPITIAKRELFSLDCPKCKSPLDVTDVSFGTNIECPKCENVTWRPEYRPKWWYKLKNLIIANLISFILGIFGSLIASHIYSSTTIEKTESESVGKPVVEGEK